MLRTTIAAKLTEAPRCILYFLSHFPAMSSTKTFSAVDQDRGVAWSRRLIAFFSGVGLFFAFVEGPRVGDGSEYYAMLVAWTESGVPYMTDHTWATYQRAYEEGWVRGLDSPSKLKELFPTLRSSDGRQDFPHFWFYSLIASPFYLLISVVSPKSVALSFSLLHAVIISLSLLALFRLMGVEAVLVFTGFLLFSPILWFLNKVHTELLTFCLSTVGLFAVLRGRFVGAMLAFAILATQNPSFGLIAVLCGLSWTYSAVRKGPTTREIVGVVIAALLTLLHPLYYWIRLGVPTPQMASGAMTMAGFGWKAFFHPFTDPDLGLFANWPLSLVMLAVATVLVARRRLSWAVLPALFVGTYVLVSLYAQSRTTNFNHGGTISISRYALWYLCLFVPLGALLVKEAIKMAWAARFFLVTVVLILSVFSFAKYYPLKQEEYNRPTWASRVIRATAPSFYVPLPQVFIERYSGLGQSSEAWQQRAISSPFGSLIMINRGVEPNLPYLPAGLRISADQFFDSQLFEENWGNLRIVGGDDHFVFVAPLKSELARFIKKDGNSAKIVDLQFQAGFGLQPHPGVELDSGWHRQEESHRWTSAEAGTLFTLNRRNDLHVRVHFLPLEGATFGVDFNGARVGVWPADTGSNVVEFTLPKTLVKQENKLTIWTDDPWVPAERYPANNDTRRLGIPITRIEIERVKETSQ